VATGTRNDDGGSQMSDDANRSRFITRRSPEETERELRASETPKQKPGGAEGGDHSPAADTPPGLPAFDESPLGDTDQHSSSSRPRDHDSGRTA
jgi:hypothetical protein